MQYHFKIITVLVIIMAMITVFFSEEIDIKVKLYKIDNNYQEYQRLLKMPFNKAFEEYYFPQLDSYKQKRSAAFAKLLNLAEKQALKRNKPITIVETGSIRKKYKLFSKDGFSTLIFNHFVDGGKGVVYSVDINPICKEIIEKIYKMQNVKAYTMDSIQYLAHFINAKDITILYLDSYDVDFNNSQNSATHHLNELKQVFAKLASGALIAVDDNITINGVPVGKGYMVESFLENKADKIFDSYIKIFQVR